MHESMARKQREESLDPGSLTRRELLVMSSAAVASAGLAGCNQGIQNQSGAASGDDTLDTRITWSWAPGDTNLNRFAQPGNYPINQQPLFFDQMIRWSPTQNKWVYQVADGKPEIQGCEVHVTFKDTFTWWDGTPVTAKDYIALGKTLTWFCCGGPDAVPWEPHLVDEYHFYEERGSKPNQGWETVNMTNPLPCKYKFYKPYIERLEDASTDKAVQSIVKELSDVSITLDDMMEQGLGYGLWKIVDYSSSSIVLEKHDGHPYADRTDLERWKWHVIPEDQVFYQTFQQDELDFGSSEWEGKVNSPPSGIETKISYPGLLGRKLAFNWRNKHLARRPVRRAIGYMLNLAGLEQTGGSIKAVSSQTGIPQDELAKEWLGADFVNQLIDYSAEPQEDKATQILENAGYSQPDDVWVDSDGSAIEGLRFISSSGSDEVVIGNTISNLLKQFGIKASYSAIEGGSFESAIGADAPNDFDMLLDTVGGNGQPHPGSVYKPAFRETLDEIGRGTVADITPPDGCTRDPPEVEWTSDKTPIYNIPLPFPKMPKQAGEATMNGDGERFRPIVAGTTMSTAESDEQVKEAARNYAWWFNYHMPFVTLHGFMHKAWLDTENFTLDESAPVGKPVGLAAMSAGRISTS